MHKTVAGMATMGVMLFPGAAFANDRATNDAHTTSTANHSDGKSRGDQHTSNSKGTSFDDVKARCVKAIADRQARLDRVATKVAANPDPHDADLLAIIASSKSALVALQAEIDADTGDLAALKEDCQRIVTDNRIYALRLPQINLVMSIDRLDASMAKFDALHDQLVAAIAAANTAGDPDAAEAAETLTKLEAKLASAKTTLDGIDVGALLALTPADYNAKLLEAGDDTDEHDG
jgi:hypothetical protein